MQQIFQDRRQYCVPFYQRAYVWNQEEQWEPLWEDIKAKARARLAGGTQTPHFLGAVVVEPQKRIGLRGVETFHIIDGQQRLTTLQYVLAALLIALRETGVAGFDGTIKPCMLNNNPDTMIRPEVERYKVWPTFRDRDSYERAMAARELATLKTSFPNDFTQAGGFRRIGIAHPPSLAAIWFFAAKFCSFIASEEQSKTAAAEALAIAILQDLKLVLITLEADDDAQVIFETMNGRGAVLHATDLIRNFIFMRADRDGADAQALYDNRWKQFESPKWSTEERRGRLRKPRLEWLIYTALQAETHADVDLPRLYADYKTYVLGTATPRTAEAQLATLDQFAEHYTALTSHEGALPVARFGGRIAAYETTTVYPLALAISTAPVGEAEKAAMFGDLVSYVVRRAVCGLTSKNYNNTFMGILRHLAATAIARAPLREYMASLSGEISRWPTDAEFRNDCKTAAIYDGRLDAPKTRQLLTELEATMRAARRSEEPEIPNLSSLDIDHIMPRSWYAHWPLPDGSTVTESEAVNAVTALREGVTPTPRQDQILARQGAIRTLGNLTLLNLSVNREAQNKEFEVKRDLLIRNTNLSLNVQLLAEHNGWTIERIATRGEALGDTAVKLYRGPVP